MGRYQKKQRPEDAQHGLKLQRWIRMETVELGNGAGVDVQPLGERTVGSELPPYTDFMNPDHSRFQPVAFALHFS
ncbi:MAG: hypothetical protein ACI3YG_10130 [Prevotella sp.]